VTHTIAASPIRDLSWMRQILTGIVHERDSIEGYRFIGVEPASRDRSTYRFRMLFFGENERLPMLSINLESSILGSPCYTIESGSAHALLGPAMFELPYAEFRICAIEEAKRWLSG